MYSLFVFANILIVILAAGLH